LAAAAAGWVGQRLSPPARPSEDETSTGAHWLTDQLNWRGRQAKKPRS